MQVHQNFSLKKYNTFGVDVKARFFARFQTIQALYTLLEQARDPVILGGGSNVLFRNDYDGWVLKNEIRGVEVVQENETRVWVRAGAGVIWHDLVMYTVQMGWGGLENLALIPGCVGASPIQNIGAYGVEIQDVFHQLEAYDLEDRVLRTFDKKACEFGYRDSIFKRSFKGRMVITAVTFELARLPVVNVSYSALAQKLLEMKIEEPGVSDVARAVIAVRQSKLPAPDVLGNAGSFFKNPVVDGSTLRKIQENYTVPFYVVAQDQYKIPAGWLIEQCGWKGARRGTVGCYEKQALVIVNFGGATGEEIFDFSGWIIDSVYQQFSIVLEREVNVF